MRNPSNEIRTVLIPSEGEYVDLIDVIGFLWRAKLWACFGIVSGVIAAFTLFSSKMEPTYYTSLILKVDSNSMSFVKAELAHLLERPEFQASIAKKYLEHSTTDELMVNGKFPAKIVISAARCILEVASKSSDLSGARAWNIANDIHLAVNELHKRQRNEFSAEDSSPVLSEESFLQSAYTKLVIARNAEEAPHRMALFALEGNLSKKYGLLPIPSNFEFVPTISDNLLRILAAVDGRISSEERTKIIADYGNITGRIMAIHAKYDQPIKDFTAQFQSASAGLIANVMGALIQSPIPDEVAFKASVAAGRHERKESKRPLILALAIILGALFGLIAYGTKIFIEDNRDRLKAALNSK